MAAQLSLGTKVIALPVYYVQVSVFSTVTGYSEDAIQKKIKRGVWLEGKHFRRAPDGHILMDLRAFHEWAENPRPEG